MPRNRARHSNSAMSARPPSVTPEIEQGLRLIRLRQRRMMLIFLGFVPLALLVGFVVNGSGPRRVLIRAVGPGLASFGVSNTLMNPSFTLYRGSQMLAANDDWGTAASSGSDAGNAGANTGSGSGGTGTGTGTGTGSGSGAGTGSGNSGNVTTALATAQILAAGWCFTRVHRNAVRSGLLARYSAESVA